MIIEKWSEEDDPLTKENRSKNNCVFFRRWIIADKNLDWELILNDFVKENYLIQSDANGLLIVWRNELQLEREKGKPDDRPLFKKILKDFGLKLFAGFSGYLIAYMFLEKVKLPSDDLRNLFCFAASIWGSTMTNYMREEDANDLWKAGIMVFLIFFIGYWLLYLSQFLF